MSRVGKQPVKVPSGVKVEIKKTAIKAEGPKGVLEQPFPADMKVNFDKDAGEIHVVRPTDSNRHRALHGLTQRLVDNAVVGVSAGFQKKLQIVGIGYNAKIQGKEVVLSVGFANQVHMPIPAGLSVETPVPTQVIVSGCDKQKVGQFAAEIRKIRPPEPYKGKGIRYDGEHVRRKAGKAFAGSGQ